MPFGAVVQTAEASAGAVGSLAATFSAAVAGNLLIVEFSRSDPVNWGSTPAGWTAGPQITDGAGNLGAKWYWKISTGGETSVTGATTETTGSWRSVFTEFEGPFEASPLDQSTDDETNISTVVASCSSGTTGATSQNDELAVALFAADVAANVNGSRTYSNSFTESAFASTVTNTGRPMASIAYKVLTATGTQTTTYSCTDVNDEMWGSIATFKKLASGSSIVPITLAQRRQRI